jgi:hypothetical protein
MLYQLSYIPNLYLFIHYKYFIVNYFLFLNYTVQHRRSQRTHTHPLAVDGNILPTH